MSAHLHASRVWAAQNLMLAFSVVGPRLGSVRDVMSGRPSTEGKGGHALRLDPCVRRKGDEQVGASGDAEGGNSCPLWSAKQTWVLKLQTEQLRGESHLVLDIVQEDLDVSLLKPEKVFSLLSSHAISRELTSISRRL